MSLITFCWASALCLFSLNWLSFGGVLGLCQRSECRCSKPTDQTDGVTAECSFPPRQMMAMKGEDFPSNLSKIYLSGGRELRFDVKVISHLPQLQYVAVRNVSKIFVKEHSFANITSTYFRGVTFEFSDALSLILEGESWKPPSKSPVSVLLARINHVIIQGKAFARLDNFTAVDIDRLELLENAFYITKPYDENLATITLERVRIENLARNTFHSSVLEVRFSHVDIRKVHGEAFSAIYIERVLLLNSTLHRLETAAFADHTLISSLTVETSSLHDVQHSALLSGLSTLNVIHSKLGAVRSGAVNVTVATVRIIGNTFNHVHSRSFVLKQCNMFIMENNTFRQVDTEGFTSPFNSQTDELVKPRKLNFTGNLLVDVKESGFDLPRGSVNGNYFAFTCHCNMTHVRRFWVGGEAALFQTGYCTVDKTLAKCYQLKEGFAGMGNFTREVCESHRGNILCGEEQRDEAQSKDFYLPNITSAVDFEDLDKERKILGGIFLIVVVGMVFVMVLSGLMWLTKNGYCAKARRLLLPSTNSIVARLSSMFSSGGVTPAASISRLSVHEYAELQRKMEEAKVDPEDDVPLEDKATQTLPEELTQELLQSLKEKLNDPENYSEARDMIEHLYDLIKVEENCNRNGADDDVLYDTIRPRRRPGTKGDLVSTGTRAPSPDKLLPYTVRHSPVISDYMQPKDLRTPSHTYTEIPVRPDLLPVGPPPPSMVNRPLPAQPPSHSSSAL